MCDENKEVSVDHALIELEHLICKPTYEKVFQNLRRMRLDLSILVYDSVKEKVTFEVFQNRAARLTVRYRLNERATNIETNTFWVKFKAVKNMILEESYEMFKCGISARG